MLVIDQGRQVFYGPPAEARAYFENLGYAPLPRQSTADYLTGCTDPNERRFQPGRSAKDTPASPGALETAFLNSHYSESNADAVEKYKLHMETEKTDQEAFRAAVIADKKRGVSKKSPYTLGISGQVWALTVRNFQQKLQDKFQIYTSFALSWVSASLCNSCRNATYFYADFSSSHRICILQPNIDLRRRVHSWWCYFCCALDHLPGRLRRGKALLLATCGSDIS